MTKTAARKRANEATLKISKVHDYLIQSGKFSKADNTLLSRIYIDLNALRKRLD